MPKLRKQRKRKVFRASVNRKRLRKRLTNKGAVQCPEIKKAWEDKKTAAKNLRDMGLVYDLKRKFQITNVKKELVSKIASTTNWKTEKKKEKPKKTRVPKKQYVADLLEQEANAPRERTFQLPSSQVEWVTYLMDKYGTDYKAMARDKKNYNQETWKQIRAKIKIFMGIPEQYGKYLESRGLLDKNLEDDVQHLIESDDEL